ncbi:MAG: mechanosensitive ion channel family protein [Bacteroidales bacterium]
MRRIFFVFLLVCFVQIGCVFAQQLNQNSDSLQSVNAAKTAVDLLVEQKALRMQDSLAEESLRLQIESAVSLEKRRVLERALMQKQLEDSLRMVQIKQKVERSKDKTIGYAAVFAGDTIRIIYAPFGPLAAADRVENFVKKLKEVSGVFITALDSVMVHKDESNMEVIYKEMVLCTITPADALWVDRNQTELAQEIAAATRGSIAKYQDMTSLSTILKQIGLSILVIAGCVFVVLFINRVYKKRVRRFMLSKIGRWFHGWRLRDYEILSAKRQVRFLLFTLRMMRLLLSLIVLYLTLPLLFSIFPFTLRLANTLFAWIMHPVTFIFNSVVEYIPNLFVILVIWFTLRYIVRGVKYLMNEIGEGKLRINGFYSDWAGATYNIIRFLLYAFGFVMMFPYLPGSDSDIFKGVSVFVGIIFSLGSSSAIGNIVAGMVITYMRPFKVGDHIKIGEITGDVLEKTPVVTRIKTHSKEVVTIPNSTILAASVVNYSTSAADQGVIFDVSITIGYDVPWRRVHQMMIQAATQSHYVLTDPAPFVLQTSLDDFYVSYKLCVYSKNPEKQAAIYSQLNQNIQDVFSENRVEIMSPHYRAQRDGNTTTIPPAE